MGTDIVYTDNGPDMQPAHCTPSTSLLSVQQPRVKQPKQLIRGNMTISGEIAVKQNAEYVPQHMRAAS
jgi:hypothetical protein